MAVDFPAIVIQGHEFNLGATQIHANTNRIARVTSLYCRHALHYTQIPRRGGSIPLFFVRSSGFTPLSSAIDQDGSNKKGAGGAGPWNCYGSVG